MVWNWMDRKMTCLQLAGDGLLRRPLGIRTEGFTVDVTAVGHGFENVDPGCNDQHGAHGGPIGGEVGVQSLRSGCATHDEYPNDHGCQR